MEKPFPAPFQLTHPPSPCDFHGGADRHTTQCLPSYLLGGSSQHSSSFSECRSSGQALHLEGQVGNGMQWDGMGWDRMAWKGWIGWNGMVFMHVCAHMCNHGRHFQRSSGNIWERLKENGVSGVTSGSETHTF